MNSIAICTLLISSVIVGTYQQSLTIRPDLVAAERALRDQFSKSRNIGTTANNKAVQDYFVNTWTQYGMKVQTQAFLPTVFRTGRNVIGVIEGSMYNTATDRVLVIGAHYDTRMDQPGVVDNGSGCVALVEVARAIVGNKVAFSSHTIYFVAFGFNAQGKVGVQQFLDNVLDMYLQSSGASFEGFINLDSLLIYSSSPMSQNIYPDTDADNPTLNTAISGRGDFLLMISRRTHDDRLASLANLAFAQVTPDPSFPFRFFDAKVDLAELVADVTNNDITRKYFNINHGDHWLFWYPTDPKRTITSIWFTDTGSARGNHQSCRTNVPGCDDVSLITPDGMKFLGKAVEMVVRTAYELTRTLSPPPPPYSPPTDPTAATPKANANSTNRTDHTNSLIVTALLTAMFYSILVRKMQAL